MKGCTFYSAWLIGSSACENWDDKQHMRGFKECRQKRVLEIIANNHGCFSGDETWFA